MKIDKSTEPQESQPTEPQPPEKKKDDYELKFDRTFWTFVAPFAVFMGFIAAAQIIGGDSKYWLYPLQTMVCAGVLVYFWKSYEWGRVTFGLPIVAGLVVFGLWVAPQAVFGAEARLDGFDPYGVSEDKTIVLFTIVARCLRLMVVVPLVEEIFWRGFVQRYFENENYTSVAIGTFSWFSLIGTSVAFMLVHDGADWPAAFATGLIFGWLVVRTKSIFAAVLAHAVANIALGIYILTTRQWGFW